MTKADKLIFWGMLVISVLFLLFSNVIFANSGQKTVIIEVNGARYAEYRMDKMAEPKILKVSSEFGNQEIEITKDTVAVIKSDCEDGLCLEKIDAPGEMIVCLPGRVVIRMDANGEVDGVAY